MKRLAWQWERNQHTSWTWWTGTSSHCRLASLSPVSSSPLSPASLSLSLPSSNFFFSTNFSSHVCRGALRERSPVCRIRMASCFSSVGKATSFHAMQCIHVYMCTIYVYMRAHVLHFAKITIIIIIKSFNPSRIWPKGWVSVQFCWFEETPCQDKPSWREGDHHRH